MAVTRSGELPFAASHTVPVSCGDQQGVAALRRVRSQFTGTSNCNTHLPFQGRFGIVIKTILPSEARSIFAYELLRLYDAMVPRFYLRKKVIFVLIALALVCFVLQTPPTEATVTFVQATTTPSTFLNSAGTSTITFPSSTTAGNFILVALTQLNTSSTGNISDTASDTFFLASSAVCFTACNSGWMTNALYYAPNINGGADTVHFKWNTTSSRVSMAAFEYSGIATTNPFDLANAQGAKATTTVSTGNVTTTFANELLFSFLQVNGSGAASSSWTLGSGWNLRTSNSTPNGLLTADQIVTSTRSYGNTFNEAPTTSTALFASIVTFESNANSTPNIISFSASPSSTGPGATSTLSWNVTNASSLAITPGSFSTSTNVGSTTVNPTSTTVYTLTATNGNGTTTATTSIAVDNTPPSVPTGLAVTTSTPYAISLSWTASTDVDNSSSQLAYNVARCLGSCTPSSTIATTTATAFTDTSLTPSSTYTYAVSAYDPAGNTSALATGVTTSTLSPPWVGILDPSRASDWSQAGVQGGIPTYTNICTTLSPSGDASGTTDLTALNNAITSCGASANSASPQVIYLNDSPKKTLPLNRSLCRTDVAATS